MQTSQFYSHESSVLGTSQLLFYTLTKQLSVSLQLRQLLIRLRLLLGREDSDYLSTGSTWAGLEHSS